MSLVAGTARGQATRAGCWSFLHLVTVRAFACEAPRPRPTWRSSSASSCTRLSKDSSYWKGLPVRPKIRLACRAVEPSNHRTITGRRGWRQYTNTVGHPSRTVGRALRMRTRPYSGVGGAEERSFPIPIRSACATKHKPMSQALFGPQHRNGIDSHGVDRRRQRRHQRNCQNDQRRRRQHQRIGGLHLIEQRLDVSRRY
jgi:hypothetical protein